MNVSSSVRRRHALPIDDVPLDVQVEDMNLAPAVGFQVRGHLLRGIDVTVRNRHDDDQGLLAGPLALVVPAGDQIVFLAVLPMGGNANVPDAIERALLVLEPPVLEGDLSLFVLERRRRERRLVEIGRGGRGRGRGRGGVGNTSCQRHQRCHRQSEHNRDPPQILFSCTRKNTLTRWGRSVEDRTPDPLSGPQAKNRTFRTAWLGSCAEWILQSPGRRGWRSPP